MSSLVSAIGSKAAEVTNINREVAALGKEPGDNPAMELLKGTIRSNKDALSEMEGAYKLLKEQLAGKISDTDTYSKLADGFGEMRTRVVSSALALLNARVRNYLAVMTDGQIGAEISVGDNGKIDLTVTTQGGTYDSCSGGERDRVDISIALALNDLAFAVSGVQSNLLVCDEPGGFLDSAGTNQMSQLLRAKAEQLGTVLFMTQRVEARSLTEHCWLVRRKDGVSRLEVVR